MRGRREPGVTQPPLTTYNYFFFAAFFFAAFFLAFFFAAIIVSFKVNLGMLYVRWLLRTPIARFFERCIRVSSIVLPKNSGKTVRGAAILCYSSKKKQHLCQVRLTAQRAAVCLPQQNREQ